jgi:hypothetical protein
MTSVARRLRHVEQRGWADCSVAVAAILGGRTYLQSRAYFPVDVEVCGTQCSHVARVLSALTGLRWVVVRPRPCRTLAELAVRLADGPAAVHIKRAKDVWGGGHLVAVRDGLVFDPQEPKPMPIVRYRERRWLVKAIIRPTFRRPAVA